MTARETVRELLDMDLVSGQGDIGGLTEKLGIPQWQVSGDIFDYLDREDPFIDNFKKYAAGEADPILWDRLKSALPFWRVSHERLCFLTV